MASHRAPEPRPSPPAAFDAAGADPARRAASRPRGWGSRIASLLLAGGVLGAGLVAGGPSAAAVALDPPAEAIDAGGPIGFLGTHFDRSACRTTRLVVGDGFGVRCDTWSATTSPTFLMTTVTLTGVAFDGQAPYAGRLPLGLAWGATIDEAKALLGQPWKISHMYRLPTYVYRFEGRRFGSLELTFGSDGRLERLSATTWH